MPTMHQKHVALKGILLIFILLTSLHITVGQDFISGDIPPKLQMKDRKNIWDKLKIPPYHSLKNCTIAVFSFRVTELGTVDTVFVRGDCPKNVKDSLVKHIKSTSGYWAPRMFAGKPVASKLFILPYLLDNTFGENILRQRLLQSISGEFIDFMELLFDSPKVAYSRNRIKGSQIFVETETSYLLPYGFSKVMR